MKDLIRKISSINKFNFDFKVIGYILFSLIIVFHAIALINMGQKKEGMHIDENYSYILSNSYDSPKISWDAESWNQWLRGDDFQKFLVVDDNEQFTYGKVYYNNSLDAHPPLFYYLLHTVCSFFPETFSIWFGVGLNIFTMLATQIVLFFFAKEATGSTLWGCVPVAIYGATQAFFDTALFIRMYALETLFSVLLLWMHYRLMKRSDNVRAIIWCFVITFLGIFTQYYFAILAFFLAVAMCIRLIIRKEWKILFIYAGAMLLAVALVFLVYPAGITQITGSDTNNVGKAVMRNLFDFSKWSQSFGSMLTQTWKITVSGIKLGFTSICCVAIITSFVLGKKHTDPDSRIKAKEWLWESMPFIVLGGILMVAIGVVSHISATYVYVRYIYNLLPLLFLTLSLLLYIISKMVKLNRTVLAIGIIICCFISTLNLVQNNTCSYLYIERTEKDNKIIQTYEDKPLVLVNNGATYHPTSLMHYILEADQVYLAKHLELEDVDECLSQVDCHNGVVFVVLTDKNWSKGYDGKKVMTDIVNESQYFNNYKKLGSCSFSTAYLAY